MRRNPSADQLDDRQQNSYELSAELAAKAGFGVAMTTGTSRTRVIVHEFARTADCEADDGTQLRYGVAVRLVVHVSNVSAGASLSIPFVAAGVQMGNMEASSTLTVEGYKGRRLGKLLPSFRTAFNVDHYMELMNRANQIKDLISSDVANIRPTEVAIVPAAPVVSEQHDRALGVTWALTNIADKRSCAHARETFPRRGANAALDAIEDTYYQLLERPCDAEKPTERARSQARQQLGRLRLRK